MTNDDINWGPLIHRTNNLFLRFIGNRCASVFGYALLQMVFLEDDLKEDSFMFRYWGKIANLCQEPMNKWSSYYKAEF